MSDKLLCVFLACSSLLMLALAALAIKLLLSGQP
jgi:hypothetical protein